MPYIITTRWDGAVHPKPTEPGRPNPRAVATLDEARERTYIEIAERGHAIDNVVPQIIDEAGGTIGPLPDGTVIEVRPATYGDLIVALGTVENRYRMWLTNVQVINAYNAYNADQE